MELAAIPFGLPQGLILGQLVSLIVSALLTQLSLFLKPVSDVQLYLTYYSSDTLIIVSTDVDHCNGSSGLDVFRST